jgi:chitin disaccharide deacetylase
MGRPALRGARRGADRRPGSLRAVISSASLSSARDSKLKDLIVTADDFGLAPEVNEAVERAHRDGILTAASLMVGAPAAADAVARAARLPKLRVGLHVVLIEGRPVAPAAELPDLVDRAGHFRNDMLAASVRIFLRPHVRRQVAVEIAAQFTAFAATGLPLDHVDCHKHWHLHPTIVDLILQAGQRHGITAIRVPSEPADVLQRAEPHFAASHSVIVAASVARLRRRARTAHLQAPDQVFGLAWSGAMTEPRMAALLRHLPEGLTEIYTHPATANSFAGAARGYRYADELSALVSPQVKSAIVENDIRLTSYAELAARAGASVGGSAQRR